MIVAFCEPIIDATIDVDIDMMKKWGLDKEQSSLVTEQFQPLIDWALSQKECSINAGGTGQNTLSVAQWMMGKSGETAIIGAVGNDKNSILLKTMMEANGVQCLFQEVSDKSTATVIVFNWMKKRSFIASLGASGFFDFGQWDSPLVYDHISRANAIYLSCFFLRHSDRVGLALAAECNRVGIPLVLGLSSANIFESPAWNSIRVILKFSSLIFGNEDEYVALGNKLGFVSGSKLSERSLQQLAKSISNYGSSQKIIVMTRAGNPTIVCETGKESFLRDVIDIDTKDIVDTNGAGDAYAGGFLSQYVKGNDLNKCLDAGAYAAYCILQEKGCSIPKYSPNYQ